MKAPIKTPHVCKKMLYCVVQTMFHTVPPQMALRMIRSGNLWCVNKKKSKLEIQRLLKK